jgi:hypothetical protein
MTELDWVRWTFWVAAFNAAAAFLAVVLYFIKEIILPYFRKAILRKRAVDAVWCITSEDKFKLKYAVQDEREHETVDLVVPAHTTDLFLHILLKARTDFHRAHAECSFDGDRNQKPLIQYWFHPFVARGKQERRPDPGHPNYDPDHYADYHLNYHISTPLQVPKHNTLTYGFKVDTRNSGSYVLTVEIVANGIASKSSLNLRVEDLPFSKRVRCVYRPHGECFVQLRYS